MTPVAVDTSPISYLFEIELVHIFQEVYGEIFMAASVLGELRADGSPTRLRDWAQQLPPLIHVRVPTQPFVTAPRRRLHRGELDTVALAEDLHAEMVVIDDAVGVRFALERGLVVTGTLGVLVEASQKNIVVFDAAAQALQGTDFRATSELYERARILAAAHPPIAPRRRNQ
jgi:predicted nucleic acid-binding protein